MKILVTGSNGFIGCHLAALLEARGHCVFGLDSNKAQVPAWLRKERSNLSGLTATPCDITELDSLSELLSLIAPDVVVHLAAKPGVAGAEVDLDTYDAVNVRGVSNVIHACRAAKVKRIIHASSSSVYGEAVGAIVETEVLKPLGHYGRTKVLGERLMEAAAAEGETDVFVLRPFSVIGPMGRPDMAPWRFAESLMKGEAVPIHVGAGRDFTSVSDVAMAFALAAESRLAGCHTFNIGGGEPRLAIELANELARGLGRGCITSPAALPIYMPKSTHADICKAAKLLEWKPNKNFAEAVAEFAQWFLGARI